MQATQVGKRIKPGTMLLPGLAKIRQDRHYSIRELADMADVSPNTVFLLEHLRSGAEQKTRKKLAKALGTGIRDLLNPEWEAPRE